MNRQFLEPETHIITYGQDATTMETGFIPVFRLQVQQNLVEALVRTDKGLEALDEALALVERTGERLHESEFYRLKGQLLLARSIDNHSAAEACFHHALTIARRQQAKSLELRAALSLARLWQRQGKCDEARELLAPIYGWFTEGFDTANLQEATTLLNELA